MKPNKPYVKKYENGILVNPITKDEPYLFPFTLKLKHHRFWQTVRNTFFTGKTVVKA